MILDWILKQGLLPKDEGSGLFMEYPLITRKVLASQTVGFLLQDNVEFIQHANYIHTAMEGIGQGFALPLTDADVIDNLVELYRRWLFNKGRRPAPVDADEETFIRKMLRHCSLLFELRTGNVESHANLCNKVLLIFEIAAKDIGPRLGTETWEVFLRVMLGITDYLLKETTEETNNLATKLAPMLMRTLFQVWIRSKCANNTLWKLLAQYFAGWRHRLPVIQQWNALCNGFTNRVIRLLYGEDGTENVTIAEYDNLVTAYNDLSPELVYSFWYRIVYLIGEPETMTVPNNYLEVMKGIDSMVDKFLNAKATHAKPADGNSILHVYGPLLFEAINVYDQGPSFDRGKAQAFATVAKIFVARKTTPFDPKYLAALYRGLEQGLKRNNFLLSVVIANSVSLFATELKGIKMLVPSYLQAIEQILTVKNLEGIQPQLKFPQLRGFCLKIIGNFICLPHHYGTLKFNEFTPTGPGINTYWEVQSAVKNILLEALKSEDDSGNRATELWLYYSFLMENVEFPDCRDAIQNFPFFIIGKLTANQWPVDDLSKALEVLSEMSSLYPSIKKFNKDLAIQTVGSLVSYIEANMEEKKGTFHNEVLISKALYCVLDWIMADSKEAWFFNNATAIKSVYRVLEIAMTGARHIPGMEFKESEKSNKRITINKKEPSESALPSGKLAQYMKETKVNYIQPSDKIKNAASFVFTTILNRSDNFPSPSVGPFSVSSLQTESEILEANGLTNESVSVYMGEHTLLTIIRHKRVGNRMKVTLVLRDESGRYVWNSELKYSPSQYTKPGWEDKVLAIPERNIEPDQDPELLSSLSSWFSPEDKRTHDKVLNATKQTLQKETTILKAKNYAGMNVAAERPKQPTFEGEKDFSSSRLFLLHFGMGTISNYDNFYATQKFNMPEQRFNFQNFSLVDKTRERDCYQIGIVNVLKGQSNASDIFENQGGCASYQYFLENIGWVVNLNEHVGYVGGLDVKVTGQYAPYHSTYDYEVIFQVASLMPNKEPSTKQMHKTRLINNTKVVIVWNEDTDEHRPLAESANLVHIIVHPLPSELFVVKVVGKDELSMVVSKHILCPVVRSIAVSYSRNLKEDSTKPLTIRKYLIEDVINRTKVEMPIHHFLAGQFCN